MLDKLEAGSSKEPCRRFVGRAFGPELGSLVLIRGVIDEIDDTVVQLLLKRSIAVLAATTFKPTIDTVAQVKRQGEVIDEAKKLAEELRSPLEGFPELVEDIYRVMVGGFVALQELAWEQTVPVVKVI